MREILVYDDYEIHKLGAGGGTQYEEVTTEKATIIDVTDVAKTKGKLLPFGRTTQKQLSGKNLYNDNAEITNYYINNNGQFVEGSNGDTFVQSLIENNIASHYVISYTEKVGTCYVRFSFFNGDTFISRTLLTNTNNYVEVPANTTKIYIHTDKRAEKYFVDLQIESGTTPTPHEEYCGGQASPNPSFPQPIENVEGRSCRNKLNIGTLQALKELNKQGTWNDNVYSYNGIDYTINEDGTVEANGTASGSSNLLLINSLNLESGNDYILNGCPASGGVYSYSLRLYDGSSYTTEKGEGLQFTYGSQSTVRINVYSGTVINNLVFQPMIRLASEVDGTYEPYFEGKRLELNVCNKNLFDEKTVEFVNGMLDDDGQPITGAHYTQNFYPVRPTTLYSLFGTISTGTTTYRIYFYDINKNWISRTIALNTNSRNWTTPADCYYVRIQVSASVTLKTGDILLCEGTDETYEEHKEQMIPFPLAEGQKLMEGDYLADDGVHHLKKQLVLDGTEDWQNYTDLGTVARIYYRYNGIKKGGSILCDKLNPSNYDTDEEGIGIYPYNHSLFYIKINKSRLTTTDLVGCINWITNNNLFIEYELEQETIDPYTPAQAEAYNKLKNLMLYKGVNHIWTNTDGLEPNLQLTYKRKKQSNVLQVSNVQPFNNLELNNTEETPEEITTEISEE